MKNLLAIALCSTGLTLCQTSHAAPVQFQLTATHQFEVGERGNYLDPADYVLNDHPVISATFFYDSSIAADFVNMSPQALTIIFPPDYGNFSIYSGAITGFYATVENHSVSMSTMGSFVANAEPNGPATKDGFLNLGNVNSGFSVGEKTVQSVRFGSIGGSDYLSSQLLPETFLGGDFLELDLVFVDHIGSRSYAIFYVDEISAVPLPASNLLFGCALLGLPFIRRKMTGKSANAALSQSL